VSRPDISAVVLTYRRREEVTRLLGALHRLDDPGLEIIVVDNGSDDGTAAAVAEQWPDVRLVALPENTGVAGRNRGIEQARGDIVITLDDDMGAPDADALALLRKRFAAEPDLAALCFRITWPGSDRVRDWVHRPPPEVAADTTFPTYEIAEGAVAWRAAALREVGLFREDLFISHEGLDLSLRLWEAGWRVAYDGRLRVSHDQAAGGRLPWRRHYYDTRNLFWIATLHWPAGYGAAYLARSLAAMAVYSLRDHCPGVWWRAVRDGLRAVPRLRRERRPLSPRTMARIREMDRRRPGFLRLAWRRLRRRGFSLD